MKAVAQELCVSCQRIGKCQYSDALNRKKQYEEFSDRMEYLPLVCGITGGMLGAALSMPEPIVGASTGIVSGAIVGWFCQPSTEIRRKEYIEECNMWEKKCSPKD